jgi:endonuclease YncB( thermonuclease family)
LTGTSYGRVTAWCATKAGQNISCAVVRGGYALRCYASREQEHTRVFIADEDVEGRIGIV